MADITLFVLPPSNPHAPSAAVPYLAGHLAAAGHHVRTVDLNALLVRRRTPHDIVCRLTAPIRTFRDIIHLSEAERSLALLREGIVGRLDKRMSTNWSDIEKRGSEISPDVIAELGDAATGELGNCAGLIGLSCINQDQLVVAVALAKYLKAAVTDAVLIAGGPVVTTCAKYFVDEPPFDIFDFLVVNEGARAFERLVGALEKGDPPAGDNVVFRGNPKVPITLKSIGLQSASPAPPLFSPSFLSGLLSPRPVLPVFSAQGCSYGECNFCSSQKSVTRYRPVPMPWIIGEMDRLHALTGATDFDIVDNNFDPNRMLRLVDAFSETPRAYRWKATARFYDEFSVDFLRRAARAGCGLLSLGLEAYDDRALAAMNKGFTTATIDRVLEAAWRVDLPVHLYAIVGHPSESDDSRAATIGFLRDHKDYFTSVYLQIYDANLSAGVFVSSLTTGLSPTSCAASDLANELVDDFPDFDLHAEEEGVLIRRVGYPRCEELFFVALGYPSTGAVTDARH